MKRYLLKGRVEDGMFPNERLVLFLDFTGRQVAMYVPLEDIHEVSAASGLGDVEVSALDAIDDKVLVVLPGEAIESGRIITVMDSELTSVQS